MTSGPPHYNLHDNFQPVKDKNCRVMTFSRDGSLFAWTDWQGVAIVALPYSTLVCKIAKPKIMDLQFSPKATLIATWEQYAVTKDSPAGQPNLHIWDVKTGELVHSFIQKKQSNWKPQWTADEAICARNVNNEVHFFENNGFDTIVHKLHLQKVAEFALPQYAPTPCHVAAYVPGAKGQPSFVRVYQYPHFGGPNAAMANKSFYQADRVSLMWNRRGTSLLVMTVTDTSADSYYGDQGLHFMSVKGESCLVPRAKKGSIYSVEWSPNSTEFCVVYGYMPAKATLYNLKCEPVFDFGTGPRNVSYYNPQGNILCLAGFGNLRGNIEFWDVKKQKLICQMLASDSTYFEWSADGEYIVTATCSPRLRVGNGYKIWHYTGSLMYEENMEAGGELWEVAWQTALDGTYPQTPISYTPKPSPLTPAPPPDSGIDGAIAFLNKAASSQKPGAYVPPAMRNRPGGPPPPRHEFEPPSNPKQQAAAAQPENLSKAALKNKKKREAKARAKEEGSQQGDGAVESQYNSAPLPQMAAPSTGDPEKDKKIKNLRKKLQQVNKLKEQQQAGKQLEVNQLEKLKMEGTLIKEIEQLELS